VLAFMVLSLPDPRGSCLGPSESGTPDVV
jgi:hypothetical protein